MATAKTIPLPNTHITQIDPFYRYKRDMAIVIPSGQFHIITNFRKICSQIKVKEPDLMKFIKHEFNQPVQLDDKTGILKLKSLPKSIEDVLEKFIDKFVLCSQCDLPELNSDRVCQACGKNNMVK